MKMTEHQPRTRALICEDEGMTVILLRHALTSGGYEVVGEASDGESAVQMAMTLQPDFILMDINMPVINGIEATRQILAEKPIPIVILTAYSEQKLVEEAVAAGACYYIVKPIVSDQLIPGIKAAIARYEMMESVQQENQDLKNALETRKLVERAK